MNRMLRLTIVIFFMGLSALSAQTSDLTVVKGRNAKSAAENGATFSLELTNNSSQTKQYTIATKQLAQACDATRMKNYASSLKLDIAVLDGDKKSSSSTIVVAPRETRLFKIKASAPKSSPSDVWSCIEVQATPQKGSKPVTTLLKVYVPLPSDG